MERQLEDQADEIKRLQRCNNDLVSVLALPAMWTGAKPSQIVHTLLDALLGMLRLDLVYVRLKDPVGDAPRQAIRVAQSQKLMRRPEEICEVLNRWVGDEPQKWPGLARDSIGDENISIVPLRLGLQGDVGVIVAGSQRADFPRQTEGLLLSVAANQASIGLQEARLRNQQKRIADELDQRVAQRTAELAAANAELQLQVGLLQRLPVSAWTLKPDGTPDFVNQVWHEYSGQTLDFVRSDPEAWMTAVHPEDRETASRSFWEGVRSGQGFAIETRSLRARDGIYRWHLNQAVPLRDAEGKVLKFVGTTTDIDDQKRAQDELRASENNLKQIINTIPTAAWSALPDGYCDFVNQRWLDYAGLSAEQGLGWSWGAAIHPDDLPGLVEYWQTCLASGTPVNTEARMRRFDGVYRWFLFRASPLRGESGTIVKWYGTNTDIDDRKRAEEKLRQEEKELKRSEIRKAAILDSALDCIVTMDHEGRITEFNPAAERTFGYRRDEVVGRYMAEVIIPASLREQHRQGFARYLATGESRVLGRRIEMTALRADGSQFPVELAITRTPLDGPPSFSGYLRDISEHKRNEKALRAAYAQMARSEERWRSVFENSAIGVALTDLDGRFLAANPVFEQMLGYIEEELQKLSFYDVTHEDHLEENRTLIGDLLAGKIQQFQIEKRCRRKNGSLMWVRNNVSVVPGTERVTRFLMALSEDITERKQAEENLRRSEALLAEVQRISLTGGFSWHVDTDEVTFSEEAYRIFELEKHAPVTTQKIAGRIHPEDIPLLSDKIAGARSGAGDHDYEIRLRMPDGSLKYLRTISHGIRDHQGRLEYVGAIQDITRRRVSEEALGKARSELARVSRVTTLGVLTASIAHEVNQPLSGIITNASTCLRMLNADPPNVEGARETARRTIRDGNRMSEVITRLRALFGKKDSATESVNLNEAALEVIALCSAELQKNRIILRSELGDDLPFVTGDRVQLQQVILNLLRNGSDAMSAVQDRPRRLLIKTERDDGNRVRLTVQDAGVGFDPQAADQLFDAFFTTKGDGMGIGLSVSRSIIERHQGRLWATLNDGPGAAFSFSIPRAPEVWRAPTVSATLTSPPTDAA